MSTPLDADQLSSLYRAHAEAMLVYFVRRCYDAQLAVDLVGETFARAYEKRRGFRGGEEHAAAWVWAIARHMLSDALRRGALERGALRRLGVEPPRLEDQELLRVEQLAGSRPTTADLARRTRETAPHHTVPLSPGLLLRFDQLDSSVSPCA
jgi:DNA-directed RNA polymerase specialized sigma24 family protein